MLNQNVGAMWDRYLEQQVEEEYDDEYSYEDYLDDEANRAYDEMREDR